MAGSDRGLRRQTFGSQICRALADRGVRTVFGIPGIHNQELYRGLSAARIRHVLTRHEQGAGFMADGYSRATGKPGVAFVISGPGLANILTPVGEAFADSVPMLVVAACLSDSSKGPPRERLHQMKSQRMCAKSVADWCETAPCIESFCEAADLAFKEFATGRPRPKIIQVPLDELPMPSGQPTDPPPVGRPVAPERSGVAKVAELLRNSKKPLFIFGGGSAGAAATARRVVELTQGAVFTTIAGRGVVPQEHPLNFGAFLARRESLGPLASADLLIAAGTSLSEVDIWRDELGHTAPMVRVDIESGVAFQGEAGSIPVVGDSKLFFEMLENELSSARQESEWRADEIARIRLSMRASCESERPDVAPAADALARSMPEDAIVYSDMTQFAYASAELIDFKKPGRWHHPSGFGALGYALPAAIGGKIGRPDAEVIAVAGDYGFQFTMQELGVAAELGLSLPVLLWDNEGLKEIEDSMAREDIPTDALRCRNPDFAVLAGAYGIDAIEPGALSELPAAIESAFSRNSPTLVHLRSGVR